MAHRLDLARPVARDSPIRQPVPQQRAVDNGSPNRSGAAIAASSSAATPPLHAPLHSTTVVGGGQSHPSLLAPRSEDFRAVQYALQLSLAGAGLAAAGVAAWAARNPRLSAAFDRQVGPLAQVHAWVDVNGWSDDDLLNAFAQGLHASNALPCRAVCGALQPKHHDGSDRAGGDDTIDDRRPLSGRQQFLYCRVAIGRAYPVKEDEPLDSAVPLGFDSNYLCALSTAFPSHLHDDTDDDRNNAQQRQQQQPQRLSASWAETEGGASVDNFHHEYSVTDGSRVLPLYLVRFDVALPSDPRSKAAVAAAASARWGRTTAKGRTGVVVVGGGKGKGPMTTAGTTAATRTGQRWEVLCAGCDDAAAVVHCVQCRASMCEKCDVDTHCLNKVLRAHTREPLLSVANSRTVAERLKAIRQRLGVDYDELSKCEAHPGQLVEFFDPVLNRPLCVHCKMVGSHSSGAAVNHQLVGIEDAYERVRGCWRIGG
jgi:hypothetical protein